jgi:septal ring factor EnvC (AmiA/AmiB activator)
MRRYYELEQTNRRKAEKELTEQWQKTRALEQETESLKYRIAALESDLARNQELHRNAESEIVKMRDEGEAVKSALSTVIVDIVDRIR